MTRRRTLVLHLPRLATDRIRQREATLAGLPLATWNTHGNRRLLTGIDAPGTTLYAGQALADAQAMYPALVLRPADAKSSAGLHHQSSTFLDQLNRLKLELPAELSPYHLHPPIS